MVNDKTYSSRLVVSKKVKSYIHAQVMSNFLSDYPEYEGSNVTENQLVTYLIKHKLNLFYLE